MSSQLTVFQVSSHNSLERGGSIQMFRLARGLARRGHRVLCFMNSTKSSKSKRRSAQRRFENAGLPLEFLAMRRLRAMWRFRQLVRRHSPQVIHVHREEALRFVWLATLGLKVPCLVTNRGTTYRPHKRTLEWFLLHSRKLHRVLAVSQAVRDELLKQVRIRPEKVEVVYGGVDIEDFDNAQRHPCVRAKLTISEDDPLIVHVGAMIEKKGVDYLLDAFVRLHEERPTARLILVGGGKVEPIRKFLSRWQVEQAVFLLGVQEDVAPFLAAADVVVCAAIRGEGLTGSVREALLMARPVVCTAVAGNPEMVQHRKTGILVPPCDAVALADGMAYLLDHPQEARRMAQAGRQWVLRHCDEETRSARVEQIYREVLAAQI